MSLRAEIHLQPVRGVRVVFDDQYAKRLNASSSNTAILCHGGNSIVTVSATGGAGGYSGTGTFSVPAGTYSYTVTDANSCTATTTGDITQPTTLNASSSDTPILATAAIR
jgi:hypothetical protein